MKLGSQPDANVSNKIDVRAPRQCRSRAASTCAGRSVQSAFSTNGAEFELGFLDTLVTNEGTENQGVGDGSCSEDLQRGEEGAELLVAVAMYGAIDAVDGDSHEDERQREEDAKRNLAFDRHVGLDDDGKREADEDQVGDYIGHAHRQKLSVALSAVRTWIRGNLPVAGEGLAFDERGHDDGAECYAEEPLDAAEQQVPASLPALIVYATKEFGNGEFGGPETGRMLASHQLFPFEDTDKAA